MICVLLIVVNCVQAQSIDPVSLVIAKVIKAIDLKVQKLQNETIWLQQAQQVAEHELSKVKLSEITGWQQQLTNIYAGYFAEMAEVKSTIKGLPQIRKIVDLQKQIVFEYGRLAKDALNKSAFDGLLNTSMDILQTLSSVLSSQLSMKDAERFCMIITLKDAMSHCLNNIQSMNRQLMENIAMKERMQADLQYVKKLNGLK